jgi:hypothetical protein
MGLKTDGVKLGLQLAKSLGGGEGISLANAAQVADGAQELLKRALKGSSSLSTAFADSMDRTVADRAAKAKAMAENPPAAAIQEAAEAAVPGTDPVKVVLEGIAASFRDGVSNPPTAATDRVVKSAVKGTSLVLVQGARDLTERASPYAPPSVTAGLRVAVGTASGDDIGLLIKKLRSTPGTGAQGLLKRTIFRGLLWRMKEQPDVRVFDALSAFSNSPAERMKALHAICGAIGELKVDAETALKVIAGFTYTEGDAHEATQLEAFKALIPHFESHSVTGEVLSKYADDEDKRYEGLKVVFRAHQTERFTAAEIVGYLMLFNSSRAKASRLLKNALRDPENIGEIDKLFEKPSYPELDRLKEAGRSLFSNFLSGATRKKT